MTAEEDVVRQIVQQMSEVVVQWVGLLFLAATAKLTWSKLLLKIKVCSRINILNATAPSIQTT